MIPLLLAANAFAYETDQLTERHLPLADALEPANITANDQLAAAVEATNSRLRCRASPERTLRVLSRELHKRTGRPASVPSRGLLRSPGYTVYSVWMETDPQVERRAFLDPRTDIFSDLNALDSLILATAGTNSTFVLNGVIVGSDKPDHFWDLGYEYLKRSRWAQHPERGVRHGVATEYGMYGLATSRTFSWADLAANQAGYLWFSRLLTDDSELQLDGEGCVAQVAEFDWSEWVTWEWDEVLNPSQYGPSVEKGIGRHLAENREAYCDSYAIWGGPSYQAHLAQVLSETPEYAVGAPAERWDPYRLEELCGTPPLVTEARGRNSCVSGGEAP